MADETSLFRFEVSNDRIALAGIRLLTTGHEFLAADAAPGPLWRLTFLDPRTRERIVVDGPAARSRTWRVTRSPGSVVLALEWHGVPVREERIESVVVTVRLTDGRPPAWRLSFSGGPRGLGLWQVEFPIVAGLAASDDALAVPRAGWGQMIRRASRVADYRAVYPSWGATMQFMAYWAGESGLYAAAHDGDARTKRLAAQAGDAGLRLSFTLYPENMGKPRARWRLPYDAVVQAYRGDWFDAAKMYRRWAIRQKWCAKGPLAARSERVRRFASLPLNYRPTFPGCYKGILRMDDALHAPAFVHVYCWHQIPFDNNYPEYFPAKPGFAAAVKELRRRGLHVMPYINGRLWDTDTRSWRAEHGIEAAAKDERGRLYIEHWSKQKHATMCPWTEKWQDKIAGIVERIVDDLGCDAVYIDQVAASPARLCFDPSHGHPLGGGGWWGEGYRKLFARVQEVGQRREPGFFVTTESCAEPYMQAVDGYLMEYREYAGAGGQDIPLFPAVYSGYAVLFAHGWYGKGKGIGDWARTQGPMLVWGAQLGSIVTDALLLPKNAPWLAFFKKVLHARTAATRWLAFGEMRRPPRLVKPEPAPGLSAGAWLAPDSKSAALVFVNVSDRPTGVTFQVDTRDIGIPPASRYRLDWLVPEKSKADTLPAGVVGYSISLAGRDACVLVLKPAR